MNTDICREICKYCKKQDVKSESAGVEGNALINSQKKKLSYVYICKIELGKIIEDVEIIPLKCPYKAIHLTTESKVEKWTREQIGAIEERLDYE